MLSITLSGACGHMPPEQANAQVAVFTVLQLPHPSPAQPYIKGLLDPCTNSMTTPNIPAEKLYDKKVWIIPAFEPSLRCGLAGSLEKPQSPRWSSSQRCCQPRLAAAAMQLPGDVPCPAIRIRPPTRGSAPKTPPADSPADLTRCACDSGKWAADKQQLGGVSCAAEP